MITNLNKITDLTILKPSASLEDVRNICMIAYKEGYRSACIPPCFVSQMKSEFKNLKITSVVGFPLGQISLHCKIEEYRKLSLSGASELDVVISINELKSGNWRNISNEIHSMASHSKMWNTKVKIIIETCYLTEDEIKEVCLICKKMYSVYAIKTSTGFGSRGASVEDIKLIKKCIGDSMKIKASGGIKTREQAMELVKAGADIIGTSAIFDNIKNDQKEDLVIKDNDN